MSDSKNERLVPALSQAEFLSTSQALSICSGDDFGDIHRYEGSPTRNVPEERFNAYSYWPSNIAGQSRQNRGQRPGREIYATHDFPDPQLRSPPEQRFTQYSYWPGESFSETEYQDAHDLNDLQVRIPHEERFTSYWRGGAIDEKYQNQSQQSGYDLDNAYNAGIDTTQNPADRRMAAQSTGHLSCNSFEKIMRQSAAANLTFGLSSYQETPTSNFVQQSRLCSTKCELSEKMTMALTLQDSQFPTMQTYVLGI